MTTPLVSAFAWMAESRLRDSCCALLILFALAVPGCREADQAGSGGPQGGPPPAVVEVVSVRSETLDERVDLVGQLEAEESVMLRVETPGVIESIAFEEGQEVRKGAVLFRLRDDEQQARLHEAEANLALASDTWQRTRALASRNVSAAAQLEKSVAELAAARARVELAKVALDRTVLRAPFDGRLSARRVSPGDRVDSRENLAEIHAVARLQLVFTLPEVGIPIARTGAPVSIRVAPFPDQTFPGEVFFVAPALDPATRRLSLKAWVPNPDRRLRPGMFANIDFEIGRREAAIVIPEDAIAYDANGSFVWRVGDDRRAERVAVEPGVRRDRKIEIRSGLSIGDRIVAGGTHKVVAGGEVVPATEAEPASGGAAPSPARRDGA